MLDGIVGLRLRHDLGIADPTFTRTHHDELPNPGRIIPGTVHTDETTTLTPDVIIARIKALYLAGLERCYRKALVADPSLTGKVALTFTVCELPVMSTLDGEIERLWNCGGDTSSTLVTEIGASSPAAATAEAELYETLFQTES